ncbi:hypothetical protein ACWD33_04445 [Streptomyces xiamenensis]|nr:MULTISPECIES: hypothetical protein [Streptomyces]MCU4749302.1 hypothetical protein [Streptomyces sp. G-5]
MERLSEITLLAPATPDAHDFLHALRSLLAEVTYADTAAGAADHRLTLTPPRPAGALPVTAFALADVPTPRIAFDTGHGVDVWVGETPDPRAAAPRIGMDELTRRLAGHVRRVDHLGVSVPASGAASGGWDELVAALASASTMYRYPEGEEWPFVLPSTEAEFAAGISDFVIGREPRFELVHDRWLSQSQVQLALWTDLTRAELERMFPEPEGLTLPGLGDIFRTVPVRPPWPGLGIRFDLSYRVGEGPNVWETGEWLVTEGGRIS